MSLLTTLRSRFSPGRFSPAASGGLALWLAANNITGLSDAAAISTWPDVSGTANNATAVTTTRPLYKTNILNGWPVVRFDGVDDTMPLTTPLAPSDLTVIIVQKTTGDVSFLGSSAGAHPQVRIGRSGSNILSLDTDNPNEALSVALVAARTAFSIITYRALGSVAAFRENGAVLAVASGAVGGASSYARVGGVLGGGTIPINGDVAELLVYTRSLSPLECQLIERYLGLKYAIAVA